MRHFKSFMALLLSLALVITLIPPIEGQANTAINVITPGSTTSASPLHVTERTVEVIFQPISIPAAEVPRIYYEVTDLGTNQLVKYDNTIPEQISGTNRYKFDVELFQGKNEIRLVYEGVGGQVVKSNAIFVNYTATTVISDLVINTDINFVNGLMLPRSNADSFYSLYVDGRAQNTERVRVTTNTAPLGEEVNFFGDQFYFTLGDATDDFVLVGGDNSIQIEAIHSLREYRVNRTLVYNNGHSFAYNTRVSPGTGVGITGDRLIVNQPHLTLTQQNGPHTINVTTDLKLNLQNGNELRYNYIDIYQDQDTSPIHTIEIARVDGNTYRVVGDATNTNRFVENFNNEYVLLSGITFPVELNELRAEQELRFVFYRDLGTDAQDYMQQFNLVLNNPYAPAIDEVSVRYDASETFPLRSGSNITNTINYAEFQFEAEVSGSVDGVRLYTSQSNEFITGVWNAARSVWTFNMGPTNLTDGVIVLDFVPVRNISGTLTEYEVGSRRYTVRYNPTPYIYLDNIVHGQIFEGPPPNFLRIVPRNIQLNPTPASDEIYPITVSVNDATESFLQACEAVIANGQVQHFNVNFTQCGRNISLATNGLNTVKINLYAPNDINFTTKRINPGAQPIASYMYEFFVFEQSVPVVNFIDIQGDGFETINNQAHRFFTQNSSVTANVRVSNYGSIEVIINTLDSNGQAVQYRYRKDGTGNFVCQTTPCRANINFTTNRNRLDVVNFTINNNLFGSGTTTIEVIARSAGEGRTHSRMIEIVREPRVFNLVYPAPDSRGISHINGNFSRVHIYAEGADRIIHGRNEVALPTEQGSGEFIFELKGLKKGTNRITLTIGRGSREDKVTITLNNVETPVVGAQFKASVSTNRIRAFDRQVELSFPRGTVLQRNDESLADRKLSPNKEILFGIADPNDGRVDKILHPVATGSGPSRLSMFGSRFRNISNLIWIDTGSSFAETRSYNYNGIYNGGIYPYEVGPSGTQGLQFYSTRRNDPKDMYVPSNIGELTLAYDPYVVQSAWRYVTVFHYGYEDRGNNTGAFQWRNLGGVVNQRNNTITVPFEMPGYYVVMYLDHSFDDIIGHPWARNHLDTLFAKGIMKNKESNRFSANEAITRGEFAQLLVKAYNIPLDFEGPETFRDVTRRISHPLYEYKYIETAARKGIVRGSVGLRFEPNSAITREDAAVMIARAANMRLESNLARAKQRLDRNFTDVANIHDYAVTSVFAVQSAGLIEGKTSVTNIGQQTNYFDPKANLTRAEAGAIVMRVLLREKKIPEL